LSACSAAVIGCGPTPTIALAGASRRISAARDKGERISVFRPERPSYVSPGQRWRSQQRRNRENGHYLQANCQSESMYDHLFFLMFLPMRCVVIGHDVASGE